MGLSTVLDVKIELFMEGCCFNNFKTTWVKCP